MFAITEERLVPTTWRMFLGNLASYSHALLDDLGFRIYRARSEQSMFGLSQLRKFGGLFSGDVHR